MSSIQKIGTTENTFSLPFLDTAGDGFEQKRNDNHMRSDSNVAVTWRELLEEFSVNTTLHGIRHIVRSDAFILRRLIWLLLTATCSGLLVFQIVDRVLYYYDSPVTVNLQINYNQSLLFPALTICNQNTFRATEARRLGWYRLVESMYRNSSEADTWLQEFNVSNLSLEEMFLKMAHKKEDFIIECFLANKPCSAENFTVTLTDHGVCYTFHRYDDIGNVINVTNSGSDHGLKLILNAEQYEAMPGPHDATGIKILATEESEHPRVNEIGMAIPTGAHAFVGLGVVVINNLPKPHGNCGEVPLYSQTKYSKDDCELECITKVLATKCGCRHFYMPVLHDGPPVCTIQQYFNCFQHEYEMVRKRAWYLCDCPTACEYLLFDPDISYATTSVFAKDHLLEAARSKDLVERFYEARETSERMNEAIFNPFRTKLYETSQAFDALKTLLVHNIQEKLQNQLEFILDFTKDMGRSISAKQTIYKYQKYSLEKNFMRGRDAMEERTFSSLCFGFHEYVFHNELLLNELAVDVKYSNRTEVAQSLHVILTSALRTRIETARKAFANYTQLYNAYETGDRIFNYKFRKLPRRYNSYINPRPLLNASLRHNTYARRYAPRMGEDIMKVLNATAEFQKLVDEVFGNTTNNYTEKMKEIDGDFIDACEDYFHSKSTFYFETVDRPERIIRDRITIFNSLKQDHLKSVSDLRNTLEQLNDTLRGIRENFLENLSFHIDNAKSYINDSGGTKRDLSEGFTSKNVSDDLYSMQVFFADIRQRGQFIFDIWFDVKETCLQLWKRILNDEDSMEYYIFRKMNKFLQNFTDVQEDLNIRVSEFRNKNDLRFIIGNRDNIFVKAMEKVIHDLEKFKEGNKMNDEFVRNNFLQIDVYYKELRHEQIDQQKAYSVIALLCDIGGSMGLFVGASVMTIYEVLDLILNYVTERTLRRIRKKKKGR